MPNVALEAMACGRAVVAARVGGLIDLIDHGETGLLVDDTAGLRAALESLRRDPRPELGRAARARVPGVDAERAAFERLFERLTRRSKSSRSREAPPAP